jgi:hypothetical protein
MVKSKRKNSDNSIVKQGKSETLREPAKINASTNYELTDTRMTAYGGLLAFTKFLDLVNFRDAFDKYYCSPSRKPLCGCYKMMLGFIMLLFIGFARIGQLWLIREDTMVCGILGMKILPAISTFWRYLATLGLNQSAAILRMSAELRFRVWQLCSLKYDSICVNVDTTVSTVYGNIEGSRKGHNIKHRGKKGLRPVFLFIEETREYLCGTQRSGTTMTDEEMAGFIRSINKYLPPTVKHVLVKGDAEFIGGKTIKACEECGYKYIFANKRCAASFLQEKWYTWNELDYNETIYQPKDWEKTCRFVVMRIREDQREDRQLEIFEDQQYMHRVFATNCNGLPHTVIKAYDKRASIESLIKEAQQEGILAIPSKRFLSNHCFFQIVMLVYNIWRWMKLVAGRQQVTGDIHENEQEIGDKVLQTPIVNQTVRIARLKMLFIAAKVTCHKRITTVKYSEHDARASELIDFMSYLDSRRIEVRPWVVPLAAPTMT